MYLPALSATDMMSAYMVQNQMVKAGFSKLAVALSLRLLENRGFMESVECGDDDGDADWQFRFTSPGVEWLLSNQDLFRLRNRPDAPRPAIRAAEVDVGITDEDVPF